MLLFGIFFCVLVSLATIAYFVVQKRLSKMKRLNMQSNKKPLPSSIVEDFSGDSRWDTELDLAKAYLELHHYEKAKHLLKSVITHGDPHHILEARKMFTALLRQERTE